MITSLVTGGAGFIGAHVVRHLQALGHKVVVLDDLSGGKISNLPPGIIFIQGSITDHELVDNLFEEHSFEYVYHLAAYAAEGLSHFIKRFNYTNNLIGSVNLINASIRKKIKCFVFTSSIAVYGSAKPPMDEMTICVPEDPYGIAKLAVEQELRVSHEMFGMKYIIFRPHNVYGEYQNLGDKYRNVVGIFMNQIMQGIPLSVFGDGEQTRAFSYIDDVAPHIANAVNIPEAYNQVVNIGADQNFSINKLAKTIADAMGANLDLRYLPARNEVLHAYSDHNKAKSIFGSTLTTTLEEGIFRMAEWAKKEGINASEKFKDIEITENMPAFWLED